MDPILNRSEILKKIFGDIRDPSQRIIAFVGAGISRGAPAEIPIWTEVFNHLCERCSELGYGDSADYVRKIAAAAQYKPQFLTPCFDVLQESMGQIAYEMAVKQILSPKQPGAPPALKLLAKIPFTGIITTNLDKLIEDAWRLESEDGKRPTLADICISTEGHGQGDLARKRNWLWKIHGSIDIPDSWIFTSKQYAKSIYSNESYIHALQTIVQGARIVFLGYGVSDPDIELILKLLADHFGGRGDPHILLTRSASGLNKGRLANLNIQALEYGGPEDHSALLETLDKFPRFPKRKHIEADLDVSNYKKWLSDETGYIDIRGIGGREGKNAKAIRFPILDLYTKLYVLRGLSNWDLDKGKIRGENRIELAELIKASRCVAIMGDPGSGKTTFLRYIARSYLEDPTKPMPIYFSIADIHDFTRKNKLKSTPYIFLNFLLDLSESKNLRLNRKGLEKKINAGECIWLIDSLDLLSSIDDRETMVRVLEEASRQWDRCKFVLVSRPRAMRGKAIPVGFDLVGIDELQEGEIRSFLETWTDLLFEGATEETRRRHSNKLLSSIRDSSDLRSLAKNPVMLTCMAVVHYNEKRLPEGKADLLEAVIQWLITARDRRAAQEYETSRSIESIYRDLALSMVEAEEGPKDRIGRGVAAEIIAKHFNGNIGAALEFLTEEETGVLVHRGEGNIAFWHQWFQEYLAAKEIAGKTDDEMTGWWFKLRDKIDGIEWREIVSFVPACLNRLGSDRVDLFFARLANSCEGANMVTRARRVGLGGFILKDLRVIGYQAANVANWNALLKDILVVFEEEGEKIPLEDRFDAAVAFGLGGDTRLRNFEETWVQIPAGSFYMGAQGNDKSSPSYDLEAAPWESPVTEIRVAAFELRKYPITVEEFAHFTSDDGYQRGDLWLEEGWKWCRERQIEAPDNWEEQLLFPNCPVTGISWFEAMAYCQWLTLRELIRNIVYRLPSEAEWEYAVRRGVSPGQRFPWGNRMTEGDKAEANWAGCNLRKKSPVGMFPKSNTLDGIADMLGNIEEWCLDSWSPNHSGYSEDGKARANRLEERRVVRGGSTIRYLRLCRPTYRSRTYPNKRYPTIGFRPVRDRDL